ncbi:hypothetical protein EPHNCH_0975 [Anaplasma phagocytophilum str. NCH-1]|uniref:Uncharacterized protein n=1 Tax=Anaplasma phagocytophilum str. NCH-1 TaxID=1359161 RepID=A0A0F3NC58_ANAPH|nr:hypothetical protein EPHNCH_0975 [Anaplasma phagocytophilum str. NCH-1]KJV82649.1 hypothetical protein APHHGE2_0960 [Anaplasma phagocytophilum str. HGE2]
MKGDFSRRENKNTLKYCMLIYFKNNSLHTLYPRSYITK